MESVFCHIRGTHADAASSYGPLVRLVGSETEIQRDRESKRERESQRERKRVRWTGRGKKELEAWYVKRWRGRYLGKEKEGIGGKRPCVVEDNLKSLPLGGTT